MGLFDKLFGKKEKETEVDECKYKENVRKTQR